MDPDESKKRGHLLLVASENAGIYRVHGALIDEALAATLRRMGMPLSWREHQWNLRILLGGTK
jgi:hypothetical protein